MMTSRPLIQILFSLQPVAVGRHFDPDSVANQDNMSTETGQESRNDLTARMLRLRHF